MEQKESTSLQQKRTSDISRLHREYRKKIVSFENVLRKIPGFVSGKDLDEMCPLKHEYADGCYIRTIFMPTGTLITSKIHKVCHPYFVMTGRVKVITEEGSVEITAPYNGITPAGTKRAIHVLEDCLWSTVHVTNETDLEKIEEQVIAKNFGELEKEDNDGANKVIEQSATKKVSKQ